MEREKFVLKGYQGRSIVYDQYYIDDSENEVNFELIEDVIDEQGRWSTYHSIVVKRLSDGKFFSSSYSEGSTEIQDESPYEYTDAEFIEVVPMEKTVTYYGWE